jgi:RluA family pseudouridine synthase
MNTLPKPDEDLVTYRSLGKPIPQELDLVRLDNYLSSHFPFHSRNQWQKAIKDQLVRIDNIFANKPSLKLRVGQSIFYLSSLRSEPEVNNNIAQLAEDHGILVLIKPSNLPMHEGGVYFNNTFAKFVNEIYGPSWSAVHRLDRETSGIVLCASTQELRNALSEEFRQRFIQKTYLCLVKGTAKKEHWVVTEPIGKVDCPYSRNKHGVTQNGLPSETTYKVLTQGKHIALLEASPKTGRTHQIRIHAAFSGLPLVGDMKHQPDGSLYAEYIGFGYTQRIASHTLSERLCLHAQKIKFEHPITKKEVEYSTNIPKDFLDIWFEIEGKELTF